MHGRFYLKVSFLLIFFSFMIIIILHNINNQIHPNSNIIVPQLRVNTSHDIKIVTIVNNQNTENYKVAISTIKCYAAYFKYDYILINTNGIKGLYEECNQKDYMYRRHCFLARYMEDNFKDGDMILVLDADIGIINPSYVLEQFMPRNNEEIIFYERIFNHEIMAGSFFLRNSDYTRKFLLNWANYDSKHPKSFDGRDNVGLHYFLLDYIPDEFKRKKKTCYKLWERSKNWKDCSVFVACLKYIINHASSYEKLLVGDDYYTLDNGRIKILKKGSQKVWVRDVWLTDSLWSRNDFMLHGLKQDTIGYFGFGSWHLPIKFEEFDLNSCHSVNYINNWVYYKKYFTTNRRVRSLLNETITQTRKLYQEELKKSGILNY
uniref:Glyco_trans_2-like domain-containing protein n=1 Tax=Strongyloides papillosus TaxID=174720 RepID=A0A0N5C710_STREA